MTNNGKLAPHIEDILKQRAFTNLRSVFVLLLESLVGMDELRLIGGDIEDVLDVEKIKAAMSMLISVFDALLVSLRSDKAAEEDKLLIELRSELDALRKDCGLV